MPRRFLSQWTPLLLLVPIGIAVPLITAALAQWKVRHTPLRDAIAAVCLPAEAQSITDVAMLIAWNFMPYAALMVVLTILIRHASRLSTWLAFMAGTAGTGFVFALTHIEAEELLLEQAWTASALASSLASLYALAVSFILAASVGALTWAIQERVAPSAPPPQ